MAGRLRENVHGYYSCYHLMTVTSCGIRAAPVDITGSLYTITMFYESWLWADVINVEQCQVLPTSDQVIC